MKGFTKDHKFVPMTDYKKVTRKSRDPEAKTQGVVIRKARTVTKLKKLPDVFSSNSNYSFQSDKGEISLSLDDFGWRWSGEDDQLNGFMARMTGTGDKAWNKMITDFEKAKVTVDMLKPHLLKNLSGKLTEENDDGMYELSGDNSLWKFGETDEGVIDGEFEHFLQEGELKKGEEEEFEKEFWNHYKSPTYEKWLEIEGNGVRQELIDGIKNATDFDELNEAFIDVHNNIQEQFHEFQSNQYTGVASWEAVEAIKDRREKEGKERGLGGKKPDVFEASTQ